MRYLTGFIVSTASVALLSGCGLKHSDYANETAKLTPDDIQMWQSPIVNTPEMSMEKVDGYSEKIYLLGIPIGGDSNKKESAWVYDNMGKRKPRGLAAIAAGRAIDSAGADGLYITRTTENKSGFVPFYFTVSHFVSGYPVTITTPAIN